MKSSTRNLLLGALAIAGTVYVARKLMKPAAPVAGLFTDNYQGPLSGPTMPGMRRGCEMRAC
jgi:hypothetical protein